MLGGRGLRPPRRRAVELDATSRIRPTPSACGRCRRTTSSSSTRRSGERVIGETDFTQRPVDAPRESDLHRRRAAVPGRALRLRRPQGVRAGGRLRLLHRRDHLHEGHDPRHVQRGPRRRRRRDGRSPSATPSTDIGRTRAAHGEVHVVSRVVGFKKIKFYTNENVGSGELDLPEQQMHTSSYWLTIPAGVMAVAAVRRRRQARRRRRAGVRDAATSRSCC